MTISETGKSRAGFTILELLLVLVLIIGITSLFVANFDQIFREKENSSVENAFWKASREANLEALYSRRPVSVFFDEEVGEFVMSRLGEAIKTFPASTETQDGRAIHVSFVQPRPGNSQILIGGRAVDTQSIDQVVFYPDGTCTAFSLEIGVGADRRRIQIDPWTGAEMLAAKE